MNRSTREEVLASDAVIDCNSRVALNPMTSYVRTAFRMARYLSGN